MSYIVVQPETQNITEVSAPSLSYHEVKGFYGRPDPLLGVEDNVTVANALVVGAAIAGGVVIGRGFVKSWEDGWVDEIQEREMTPGETVGTFLAGAVATGIYFKSLGETFKEYGTEQTLKIMGGIGAAALVVRLIRGREEE